MRHVSEMLRRAGHVAHVTGPTTFATGTLDVDWLPQVGARGWVLITKDQNIRKREIELRALRESGVRAFVLTSGSMRGEEQARVFEEALPAMLRLLRRHATGFVARVTAHANVEIIEVNAHARARSR